MSVFQSFNEWHCNTKHFPLQLSAQIFCSLRFSAIAVLFQTATESIISRHFYTATKSKKPAFFFFLFSTHLLKSWKIYSLKYSCMYFKSATDMIKYNFLERIGSKLNNQMDQRKINTNMWHICILQSPIISPHS